MSTLRLTTDNSVAGHVNQRDEESHLITNEHGDRHVYIDAETGGVPFTEQQQQRGRKMNLLEFLLYNSLVFGMCFAKVGGPPIFACPMAGCCCMDVPPNFDVRSIVLFLVLSHVT